ncbi:MAG: type II toxin-antitoxin system VapC family toxin [Spirochaetia bacterium]|nr:type II toxin-antitoxin system VapC family toxin [Spirochaetia bacterium]
MILLDTNYLIRFLVEGTYEAERVKSWIQQKKELCTSSICWYEFSCGPVDEEAINLAASILNEQIFPFSPAQAREAARLFNRCGRTRSLRVDAMVAAAAIISESVLATENSEDFAPFASFGLKLI